MSVDACTEMVRSGDPDRFLSVMTAPVPARARLMVLYAFNLEVARAPWVTKEEMIAEMRLQWWLDAINEIYEGKVRHHEVVELLADVIRAHDLPQNLFLEIINARRFDIYREGHENLQAFESYMRSTSENLMQLAAMTLTDKSEIKQVVADFSYGSGIANLFRALPVLYANGRHPIPVEGALDKNAVAGGDVPENLQFSLKEIATKAQNKIKKARQNRHQITKSEFPALFAGWQASVPIKMAIRAPEKTLQQPLETSEFRKKAELLFRSSTGRW